MFSLQQSLNAWDSKINKRKALFPFDVLYYIIFTVYFTFCFSQTTLLYSEFLQKDYEQTIITIIGYLVNVMFFYSVYTIIFVCDGIKDRILCLGMVIFASLFLRNRELNSNFKTICLTVLFVLNSRNKNPKVLLWITYIVGWFEILLSFILSRLEIIPAYVYSGTRHGFGSVYPTDLACHFLVLVITICILKKGKLNIFDYGWYLLISAVNYVYMQAKTGVLLVLLVLVGNAIYQYIIPYMKIPEKLIKVYKVFMVIIYPFFAAVTIIWTKLFVDTPDSFLNKFNSIRLRFVYGNDAMNTYGFSWWGVYFKEVGNGGVPGKRVDYYFVDISYVRILLQQGIIFFALVLFIYTLTQFKFIKNGMLYFAYLFAVFALDCAIEHHIAHITYGMILMLIVFSDYMVLNKTKNRYTRNVKRKYLSPFINSNKQTENT